MGNLAVDVANSLKPVTLLLVTCDQLVMQGIDTALNNLYVKYPCEFKMTLPGLKRG